MWAEVAALLSKMTISDRYKFKPDQGESWREVEKRLTRALGKILSENEDKTVAVVTHGGTIRTLIPYLLNAPLEESFKYDPKHLSFTIFDDDGEGFSRICIDDVSHLQ